MQSFVDELGPLRLWTCCPQELDFRLVWDWQRAIKCDVSHRPGFQGLEHSDPLLTRRVLLSLPVAHRPLVMLSLNGTFCTNDALHHIGEGLRALQDIPDTSSVFEHVPHQAVYDLFTDGSCLYPAESYLRVAAWGVVVAGGLGAPGTLLATGHLPGLIQSAFRAELTAVISAAQFAAISHSKVRIWSDCLGVVKRDLWHRLAAVVRSCRDRIEIIKVEAHCASDAQATFVEEWCAHYNTRVDNLAGTTVRPIFGHCGIPCAGHWRPSVRSPRPFRLFMAGLLSSPPVHRNRQCQWHHLSQQCCLHQSSLAKMQ